jgi:type 1 glutamine amidotransferase
MERSMRSTCFLAGSLALLALLSSAPVEADETGRILIFSKTAGFRHDSIPVAVQTVQRLAREQGLQADHSEDAAQFTRDNLARYRAVVFASTTGDVLDDAQQAAMQQYIRDGGGYMGVHAAADTEYDWPWYGQLVGAWFHSHPEGLQSSRVQPEHEGIPSGPAWAVRDELYNYRDNPRPRVQVLATLDESRYRGGTMGGDHPISWCHAFDGGRSWYTGLGHDAALYADPDFLAQLRRGLRYASSLDGSC